MKKRLVSGITATGNLTIGNYLGAIKNFVQLQDEYEIFIFVADMHALTIDIEPDVLHQNKQNIMALYIAAGLDPSKATLFYQSDVLEHGQMSWIMQNQTTIGELERMTQYKDKSQSHKQKNGTIKIKTGLLTYPTMMAGDILLYDPHIVPVGKDQVQHLELTRNIATRFNNRYGKTLAIPETYNPKVGAKIMSLVDPSKKMSKSDSNLKASIFLLDDPEVAAKKIMKSVTDSEGKIYFADKPEKAGISNLITIFSLLTNNTIKQTEVMFKDKNYGEFKLAVANEVKTFLTSLQSKYKTALSQIDKVAQQGKIKASKIASQKLQEIQTKIGL